MRSLTLLGMTFWVGLPRLPVRVCTQTGTLRLS